MRPYVHLSLSPLPCYAFASFWILHEVWNMNKDVYTMYDTTSSIISIHPNNLFFFFLRDCVKE